MAVVKFEINIPDSAATMYMARETIHKKFAGNPDYINNNVVLNSNDDLTDVGLYVVLSDCENMSDVAQKIIESVSDVLMKTPITDMIIEQAESHECASCMISNPDEDEQSE